MNILVNPLIYRILIPVITLPFSRIQRWLESNPNPTYIPIVAGDRDPANLTMLLEWCLVPTANLPDGGGHHLTGKPRRNHFHKVPKEPSNICDFDSFSGFRNPDRVKMILRCMSLCF